MAADNRGHLKLEMKKILRWIFQLLFLILFWPLLLYKRFGSKPKLEGNTLIIANHYSNIDPFLIKLLFFKSKIHYITIAEVRKKIITRFMAWLFDAIYMDEKGTNLSAIKKTVEILKAGGVVCIFPEGLVNPRRFGFLDFQKGVSFIAKRAQSKVLPLFMYPEFNIHKKSKIYIGDIIPFDEYSVYKDHTETATYFLSKVMELSAIHNKTP